MKTLTAPLCASPLDGVMGELCSLQNWYTVFLTHGIPECGCIWSWGSSEKLSATNWHLPLAFAISLWAVLCYAQSLRHVGLLETPWTGARQAPRTRGVRGSTLFETAHPGQAP